MENKLVSATFKDTTIAGNAVKRYTSLDFVGIETVANQIDISGMTRQFRFMDTKRYYFQNQNC